VRTIRYREIADALRTRLGGHAPDRLLPSESELSAEFAASRVTVRKALEVLREEGLVESRQGLGWLITAATVPQRLDDLATIEAQLERCGIRAERRVLQFAFVDAPRRVGAALGCDHVLCVRRLNLADGEPFGVVTVWCPSDLGQHLSRRDVEQRPFYELLGVDVERATQTIAAGPAAAADAELLGVPTATAVLRCERITYSADGSPVLMSEHVFPAHRTEFVVDLRFAATVSVPGGLRLVD
jgi:GntR family transcriptional regulator